MILALVRKLISLARTNSCIGQMQVQLLAIEKESKHSPKSLTELPVNKLCT
jgi:hypothetical protein